MSLTDLLVVVTGGGSGIGRATCEVASKKGALVVVADINLEGAEETLALLDEPSRHLAVKVDVSESGSVDGLAEQIQSRFGRSPDGLVHCAGIFLNNIGLKECDEAAFDRTIAVDLKGTFLVNRTFALLMKDKEVKGSIINMSSNMRHGTWFAPAFAAACAGVVGLTQSLAKEFAVDGIRCNVVAPGPIATPMAANSVDPETVKEIMSYIPIPVSRWGKATEVAELCVFLLSPKSSFASGSVFELDGGAKEVVGKHNQIT